MFRKSIGKVLRVLGIRKVAMQRVVKELYKRDVDLNSLNAIELFGRDGGWSTDFISKELKSIDLVEISFEYESSLREKYPNSEIYIMDTYEFITTAPKKYDLILSDNPASRHGNYYQHFSLFPEVFNLFNRETILILNIIPDYNNIHYNLNPEEEYSALKGFYNTDSIIISYEEMIKTYKNIAKKSGFSIVNHFAVSRGTGVEYLCLFFEKNDK